MVGTAGLSFIIVQGMHSFITKQCGYNRGPGYHFVEFINSCAWMRWVLRRLCNVWCHAAQLMMCGCDRGSGWRNRFSGVVAGCGVWVGADLGLLGLM